MVETKANAEKTDQQMESVAESVLKYHKKSFKVLIHENGFPDPL